jgi:hypothetical protein
MRKLVFLPVFAILLGCQSGGSKGTRSSASSRPARGPARFAAEPVAALEGGKVRVSFAVAAPTDYAAWVLDAKGNKVRHLSAGALGVEKLGVDLVWDGKDDRGRIAPRGKYTIKVGLGTQVKFDRNIGFAKQWLGNIYAMACGKRGEVYAYCSRGIVALDRQGNYLRQIAPAPAGFPTSKLAGLKPVKLKDGSVYFQRGYAFPGKFVASMGLTPQGQLILPGPARYARSLTKIGIDGSVPSDAFDTRLTMLSDIGFLHVAVSPDGKYAYASGAEAGYKGDDARKVVYRQAVYRVKLDGKGPAEIFTGDDENGGGPGFSVRKPKGLACDAKGNLYVCNYKGNNIAVYNPAGGVIKTFKIDAPQLVAVHPETGQVYCLAGREKGYTKYGYDYPATMYEARLVRFSPDGKIEAERKLEHAWVRNKKSRPGPCYKLSMAADFSGKKPLIWIGVAYPGAAWSKWNLLRIEDQGQTGFGGPKEITPKPTGKLSGGTLQLLLDRKRDLLYYNAGNKLARFTGEGKWLPSVKLSNPKDGSRYQICEAGLDPDGNILALVNARWKYRENRIVKFTPDGKWIKMPKAPEDGVPMTNVMKGGGGSSTRGFTVAPNGDMYVMYYDYKYPDVKKLAPWDAAFKRRIAVAHVSADGEVKNQRLIMHLRAGANGIRADREGNVYVGDNFAPVGVTFPSDFVGVLPDPLKREYPARLPSGSFDPLLRNMGSLLKFGPEGGRIAGLPAGTKTKRAARPAGDLWKPVPQTQWIMHNSNRISVTGAKWQFHGMSPVPAQYQGVTHVERCVCRGARFDLDEFGRAFVPDALRKRITVLDSEGNVLFRFGQPGNLDAKGPEMAFAYPWWIAAASDRVYIGDPANHRIVRLKLVPKATASCQVTR